MNDKLKDELARIAGSDQDVEAFRHQGQFYAAFYLGALDVGLDQVMALALTKNCYERFLYVMRGPA